MPKYPKSLVIIRDTREKENHGWHWEAEQKRANGIPILCTFEETVDAGDYTVRGFEDMIRIERKQGFGELYGNLINREGRERFYKEMEKLQKIPYKWILVESQISNDICSLGMPQMFKGPPCSKIISELNKIEVTFGVPYKFVGDSGKKVCRNLMEHVIKHVCNSGASENEEIRT